MKYDFRILKQKLGESGWTYTELARRLPRVGKPPRKLWSNSVSRALKTGEAHPETAKAMADVLGVPMRRILIPEEQKTA